MLEAVNSLQRDSVHVFKKHSVWILPWTSSIQPTVTPDGATLCALLSGAVTNSGYTALEDRVTNVEWDNIHLIEVASRNLSGRTEKNPLKYSGTIDAPTDR